MATKITIREYETPVQMFETLERVFGASENNGTRWVKLQVGDVELTFFATAIIPTPTDQEEDPNEGIEVPW